MDELFGRFDRETLQCVEAGQPRHRQALESEVDPPADHGLWAHRTPRPGGAAASAGGRGGAAPAAEHPIIASGLASGDAVTCGPAQRLSGGILMVDGKLYAGAPSNLWAVDARDGSIIWQNYWKARGTVIGTRGPGMLGNMIFVTPARQLGAWA